MSQKRLNDLASKAARLKSSGRKLNPVGKLCVGLLARMAAELFVDVGLLVTKVHCRSYPSHLRYLSNLELSFQTAGFYVRPLATQFLQAGR